MTTEQNEQLDAVITKIAARVGKDYDILTVSYDLDLASDDDDGLAFGAAPRLGLEEGDVRVLQAERFIHGPATPDRLRAALDVAVAGGKPVKPSKKGKVPVEPVPVATQAQVEKASKKSKSKKAAKDADDEEGEIDADILVALKECGASDDKISKGVKVSRATYNNYVNAKTPFTPDAEQYQFLRGEVVAKINRLYEALAKLDGADEPETVF